MSALRVGRTVYWQRPAGTGVWPVEGVGRITHWDVASRTVALADGTLLLDIEAVALTPCGTELGRRRHRRHGECLCNACRGRQQTRRKEAA